MMRLTLAVLLLVSRPAAANMPHANGLAAGGEVQQKWFGGDLYAKAQEAADKAKKAAEDAGESVQAATEQAKKMAADAKEAVAEVAKDQTQILLRAALKSAAGTCPALVDARNDFLKNSIPDLVDKVAEEITGDCKDLKSEACGMRLSELVAGHLLDNTEKALKVPVAKALLWQTDTVISVVDKFVTQAKCNVDAVKGSFEASAELIKVLPDGAMVSINENFKSLHLVDDMVDKVQKMLSPAKALETMWDTGKVAIQKVLKVLGSKAIAKVQAKIPEEVQKQVNAGKDKFIAEMGTYLQKNLGDAITKQLEKYCPDAVANDGDEGGVEKKEGLGDKLNAMMQLQAKIKKKLDDTEQQIKDEIKKNTIGLMVDKLKEKFPASSKESKASAVLVKLSKEIDACSKVDVDQTKAAIPKLQGKDFPMQSELDGLTDIMGENMPAAVEEHLSKLYLQNTEARATARKLGEDNERLSKILNARTASTPAASPSTFGVRTLSVVAAAMFLAGIAGGLVCRRHRIAVYNHLDIEPQLA